MLFGQIKPPLFYFIRQVDIESGVFQKKALVKSSIHKK